MLIEQNNNSNNSNYQPIPNKENEIDEPKREVLILDENNKRKDEDEKKEDNQIENIK